MLTKAALAGLWAVSLTLIGCGQPDRAVDVASTSTSTPTPSATVIAPAFPVNVETAPASSASPKRAARLVITNARVEAEHSPELGACLNAGDAAEGVTAAIAACLNAERGVQGRRLSIAFREIMASLDGPDKAQIRTEQRTWIRERDEGCRASTTGGTIDQIEIPACLLSETIRRRLVLESLASPDEARLRVASDRK